MRYLVTFFLLYSSLLFAKGYQPFLSFSASKTALEKIYANKKVLPLSGCHYKYSPYSCPAMSYVDKYSCTILATKEAEVKWMRVVPMALLAKGMPCMTLKLCLSTYSGRSFNGERCCRKSSKLFREMSSDMHNIIPLIEARKLSRLEKSFILLPDASLYPEAASILGDTIGSIKEKGEIARIYLYMENRYKINLQPYHKNLFLLWHEKYKVSAWEREKNKKIFQLQGTFNPYIEKL